MKVFVVFRKSGRFAFALSVNEGDLHLDPQQGSAMAFITNQWLRGDAKRNRAHDPVPVSLVQDEATEWDMKQNVVCSMKAIRADGDYQSLLFGKDDIPALLTILVEAAPPTVREQLAEQILSGCGDVRLLNLLSRVFRSRTSS